MTADLRTAIILAAGMGRRLSPYTDEMPKCLVPVGDRPLIAHQLETFRRRGLTEFAVVRGYKGEVLDARAGELGDGVRFVDNPSFRTTKMLASLFCCAPDLEGPYVVSYGDVVFRPEVLDALIAADGDVVVAVDRDFRVTYADRGAPSLDGAELVSSVDSTVTRIGRGAVPEADATGAFLGLARFSRAGADRMVEAYQALQQEYEGRENDPFVRSKSFRAAHLTDMLQHLIDGGERVVAADARGGWCEIDGTADLDRAAALLGSAEERPA